MWLMYSSLAMVFLHMEDGLHNLNHQEHAIESSIQLKMLNHMSSFQNSLSVHYTACLINKDFPFMNYDNPQFNLGSFNSL